MQKESMEVLLVVARRPTTTSGGLRQIVWRYSRWRGNKDIQRCVASQVSIVGSLASEDFAQKCPLFLLISQLETSASLQSWREES